MLNEELKLTVSSSPHVHDKLTIPAAMRDVLIALIPAMVMALYFFGLDALLVTATCVVAAVLSEYVAQRIMKRQVTVNDYSAVLTGVLLAFCLPPAIPLWIAAVGSAAAIIIGKQLFGGLGNNIFNPAHVGRAIMMASWPAAMTTWNRPFDGVSTATPLGIVKEADKLLAMGDFKAADSFMDQLPSLWNMFIGNQGGCIGETSAIALLLGGLYLIYKKHVDWRIPVTYLGTVVFLTAIYGGIYDKGIFYPVFHLLAGGLMIGAFFMATDWVSGPLSKKGKIVFGLGCGILTVVIRLFGGYPEGVCYSILLMNCLVPLIDRYTKTRVFGR